MQEVTLQKALQLFMHGLSKDVALSWATKRLQSHRLSRPSVPTITTYFEIEELPIPAPASFSKKKCTDCAHGKLSVSVGHRVQGDIKMCPKQQNLLLRLPVNRQ